MAVDGDFNDGKLAIGTGSYKFKSYVKGTGIELERNEKYWGPAEPWASVNFVPVPNAGPRLAGLLAGDYDVIENPAARDVSPTGRQALRPRDHSLNARDLLPTRRGARPSPFVKAETAGTR